MQLHLTGVLPSHQRGQGQLSKDSTHPDRAESCEPLPLHSSKRQQLQPALRGHTQTVQAPRLFSLSQKCQELEKLEGFFLSNLVEESAVATEQVCLLMPGNLGGIYHRKFGSLDSLRMYQQTFPFSISPPPH